ncbi:hypothetical protein [uncultured Veillonella sp.]|uniref:hypothetical protein n=1 Tax=uncultured Veillonella sp. TaxID=159268 RepID=UPI0025E7B175|nr:hypothetical protein [uncultured Veillonella sp.]
MADYKFKTMQAPTDPHDKARYEWALKHVEIAQKQGLTDDEIEALFEQILAFDFKDVEAVPRDEAHKTLRIALEHANGAIAAGQSVDVAHDLFRKIMHGEVTSCPRGEEHKDHGKGGADYVGHHHGHHHGKGDTAHHHGHHHGHKGCGCHGGVGHEHHHKHDSHADEGSCGCEHKEN